jgi:hypothetical protein
VRERDELNLEAEMWRAFVQNGPSSAVTHSCVIISAKSDQILPHALHVTRRVNFNLSFRFHRLKASLTPLDPKRAISMGTEKAQ